MDCYHYINKLPCHENIQVSLPNNTIITPTHIAYLNLPNIPRVVLKTYLFPDIPNKVLLSVSQFCDYGYKVIFNSKHVFVLDKNKIILKGYRSPCAGVWFTVLTNPPPLP